MQIRAFPVACLLLATAPSLPAQQMAIAGPRPGPLRITPAIQHTTPQYTPLHQTYAREGALIAGIPLGLLVGGVGGAFCQSSDTRQQNCGAKALLGGVAAAGITGMMGALVGSSFRRVPAIPDSVVGDHSGSFGLGFAIGGFALGGLIANGDCHSNCFGETTKGALIGAVVTGAVGYAAGSLFPKFFHK